MKKSTPSRPGSIELFVLAVTVFLIAGASPLCGQTAELTGRVMDSSDAVIVDADVTAINVDTGVRRPTTSNELGLYRVRLLPPGNYRVMVQKPGFRPINQSGITLTVDQVARIDFVLQVGPVTETVEVAVSAPLLESESANYGQVVTQRSVEELPLNGRDPMFLITLTPGVSTGSSFDASQAGNNNSGRNWFKTDFSVGGGRNFEQEVLLDGAPNTSSDRNYAIYIPPVDSTQEFKVLANPYSAEYGRTAGAVVSMVTKAGTNEFHGLAYEFHRNSVLDANLFFNNRNNVRRGSFRRHQFGANFSGPIFKDRTFFFADYEGFRQAVPATFLTTVPTELQRRGDFSQTFTRDGRLIGIYDYATLLRGSDGRWTRQPFPGNVIPQDRIDPVAAAVTSFYPLPNLPGDPLTAANNYINAAKDVLDMNKYGIRVDHHIGTGNRVFGRYSAQKSNNRRPGRWDAGEAPSNIQQIDDFLNIVVGDSHTFSPTMLGEIRASVARGYPVQSVASAGFNLSALGFPAPFLSVAESFFPSFVPSDVSQIGNGFINLQPRDTYSLVGSVSKMAGRHTFKFGGETRTLRFHQYQVEDPAGRFTFGRLFTQGPDPLVARTDAGFGFASMLLGAGTSGKIDHRAGLSLQRLYHAFFVQHDWKASSRLTVNLGLRYDVTTGTNERYNRLAWLDLDSPSPFGSVVGLPLRGILQYTGTDGNRRNQLATDGNNFGPRVGIAFQVDPSTVIRTGYGIFYVAMTTRNDGSIGFNTESPWVATLDDLRPEYLLRNPYPNGFNFPVADRSPTTNVGFGLDGYLGYEPVGYTQQWSFSVQRQVASGILVDAGYWGNKGTKLAYGAGFQENFLDPAYLSLGTALNERVANPFFGHIATGALAASTVTRRQLLLPYPQYTSVIRTSPSAASAIYHAFTLKAEKRATHDLSFVVSYTLSKIIGDSSGRLGSANVGGIQNMADRRQERHILSIDVPQRLVAGFVYDLPFGRGKWIGSGAPRIANALIGGWRLSGISTFQSGFPVSIARPSVNNGRSAKLDDPSIDRWFDTAAFSPALPFTFGNTGPSLPDVRQHGDRNFDFTLGKDFRFLERFRLQFRSEFFNAFNRPQFGAPIGNVTNPAFGQVTTQANSPREIQLGLKLYW